MIIDGKAIAKELRAEIGVEASRCPRPPHLAAVLVGDDPASAIYVRNKQRACEEANLTSTLHRLSSETSQRALLDLIADLNADPEVDGILIQLPLPAQIDAQAVLDAVDPAKDVDCFHPHNVGLMAQGRARFLPCTPAGVMHLLSVSGIATESKRAVVLGRSEIVGKPMSMLLLQKGADATVTICHSRTAEIASITRDADLLIAAIGKAGFVTGDMVKPGAVVIDVGTNRVDGKLRGDCEFDSVAEIASAITPVPGGVGPMTIAMLLKNTLTAANASMEK